MQENSASCLGYAKIMKQQISCRLVNPMLWVAMGPWSPNFNLKAEVPKSRQGMLVIRTCGTIIIPAAW